VPDILIPELSDDFEAALADDEIVATIAPPPATTTIAEFAEFTRAGDEFDVVRRRTPIVASSRRRTPPRASALRDAGMLFDYPLSEPSLWPDAFDPEYAWPFPREQPAAEPAAVDAATAPAPQPGWVQRHRVGLVVGFGIVPFVAVPTLALLGTQSARLITDLQVPQMSFFLDWVIVGAVTVVAATLIGFRYVFRRRRSAETAPAVNYEAVGQES